PCRQPNNNVWTNPAYDYDTCETESGCCLLSTPGGSGCKSFFPYCSILYTYSVRCSSSAFREVSFSFSP
ncbi:unnamed protein product, partial [Ectocarpus sp. 8 AP-2014]